MAKSVGKASPSKYSVEVAGLHKTYQKGKIQALCDIDFQVERGELFGLIGPDGAGKTSLFRILTTLLLPDSGCAQVEGWDIVRDFRQIRRHVGYMPGKFSLYTDLSVEENLHFFATLFQTTIAANYHLIRDIYEQLAPFKDRRAGQLSGGMKQKLALCCALIHQPKVLLLDEPTTGVDPVSRKEFWQMLQRLREQGITILVSTPYMDEALRCDRIALMQTGRLLSIDSPDKIIDRYPRPLYAARAASMSQLLRDLRLSPLVSSCHTFGEYHHFCLAAADSGEAGLAHLANSLASQHPDLVLLPVRPSIEDCFIQLMQV